MGLPPALPDRERPPDRVQRLAQLVQLPSTTPESAAPPQPTASPTSPGSHISLLDDVRDRQGAQLCRIGGARRCWENVEELVAAVILALVLLAAIRRRSVERGRRRRPGRSARRGDRPGAGGGRAGHRSAAAPDRAVPGRDPRIRSPLCLGGRVRPSRRIRRTGVGRAARPAAPPDRRARGGDHRGVQPGRHGRAADAGGVRERQRIGVRAKPHVYACTHLANPASLLLPVSNLTNLLAFSRLRAVVRPVRAVMALPWLVTVGSSRWCCAGCSARTWPSGPGTRRTRPADRRPGVRPRRARADVRGIAGRSRPGVEPSGRRWPGRWCWRSAGSCAAGHGRRAGAARPTPLFCLFVLALGVVVKAVVVTGWALCCENAAAASAGLLALLAIAASRPCWRT